MELTCDLKESLISSTSSLQKVVGLERSSLMSGSSSSSPRQFISACRGGCGAAKYREKKYRNTEIQTF